MHSHSWCVSSLLLFRLYSNSILKEKKWKKKETRLSVEFTAGSNLILVIMVFVVYVVDGVLLAWCPLYGFVSLFWTLRLELALLLLQEVNVVDVASFFKLKEKTNIISHTQNVVALLWKELKIYRERERLSSTLCIIIISL